MSNNNADMLVLNNADSTLTQVMQAVTNLEKAEPGRRLSIGLSSSATIDLLGLYLRKHGLLSGTHITVHQGNYDDPIGDVDLFLSAGAEHMILLPFLDTLLPSFEAQMECLAPDVLLAKELEMRNRYRVAFEKAKAFKLIFLGSFHRLGHAADVSGTDAVGAALTRFNQSLREEAAAFPNVRMIDTEDVVRTVGHTAAFDARFYFRSKAPYTAIYFNELARRVASATRGFGTHFYKVLVLDCDNTLWGGVIGEDLMGGIRLGPFDYPGNIFWRMQHEFAALERNGILLCLCSKNNPADVDEVFQKHPEMVLKPTQIIVKKVNWNDKPTNVRELAQELNVGLDSMVFLDDSRFECEAVRQQLPMVKTIQVPATLSEYPRLVQEIKELFLAGGIAADSRGKTEQYRQRADAIGLQAQFDSQEAYLASLELKVELSCNAAANVARISELSMKSNQFNLTTRRYSEAEVTQLMKSPDSAVYSLSVSDKFGMAGLTGVVFTRYLDGIAQIDNFLMSCRVIGRGVETSIWSQIAIDAAKHGCNQLQAVYVPSAKNAQVADLYERLGFQLAETSADGIKHYRSALATFTPTQTPWIDLTYVE
jgi:FkbH-like protein